MSRVLLHRHELVPRGKLDHQPPPLSWDYLDCYSPHQKSVAVITCSQGHVTRLSSSVHRVDQNGVVSPSYVCTVDRCRFHAFIQLVRWQPPE